MGNHWLNKAETSLEESWITLLDKMSKVTIRPSESPLYGAKRLDYTSLDRKLMQEACNNGSGSASRGLQMELFRCKELEK